MDRQAIMQMIANDRVEWSLLSSILDAHPTVILHEPKSPPWTARDVYAHLARWLNNSNRDLESYRCGGDISPHIDNVDEVNARWQIEDSLMSLADARNKAFEAFDRRLSIVESIPANRWDKTLERIASYDGAEHWLNTVSTWAV
jgi:hypothetical protein